MVEIRRLKPLVHIALPKRDVHERGRASRLRVTRRSVAEFPPPTPQPTPCRLWQGSVDPNGYGRMKRDGRTVAVYRWVMECAIGRKLRPDEFILHACDHPPCYRLDHLSVGSALDNNRDMITKGRHVPPPVTRLLGAMHPQAKFTSYQAARIRQDFRTGVRAITLAQEYGVDVRTIRRLVEGITYADTSTPDLLAKHKEDQ